MPNSSSLNSKTAAKERPRHLNFPEAWEHLASDGAGRYITRVIHRLPGDALHVWTSRRHRKRRGGRIVKATEAVVSEDPGKMHSIPMRHASFKYWGWAMQRLTWWIGIIFILGSICFVAGTVPMAFEGIAKWLGWSGHVLSSICFTGSVFFTIGSYLLVFEAVNIDLDLRLEMRARKLEYFLKGEKFTIPGRKPLNLWGWAWARIDYQIAIVQLTGALIFNINTGMALVSGLDWIQTDAWVWTPSTLASICFVTAAYLGIVEVCHRWWAWQPRDVSWWINLFGLLGAFGFLISSIFGFFAQGPILLPQWLGNTFALMMGSWFFLMGTYLLIPEMFLEDEHV